MTLTRERLESDFHRTLAELRSTEPVHWVDSLNGWLVTRRDLAIEVLRDADRFTVDDPRFSTARVLGPSMLSLDGAEHARHRDPFAGSLRLARVRSHFGPVVDGIARRLVEDTAPDGVGELRTSLAGPMATETVAAALELLDVDPAVLRGWYEEIVEAVAAASDGWTEHIAIPAVVDLLAAEVRRGLASGSEVLGAASEELSEAEVISNTAVMLFGGIETSEGMTATAFAHLLADGEQRELALDDPDLLSRAVDESLRLEPSVVQLDRFATRATSLGGVAIGRGDFVMVSVAAANRDPETYPDPDRFDVRRENARTHLAFAQGPHLCVGMHLARAETRALLAAAFARLPGLRLTGRVEWEGTVFRKPRAVPVAWTV